MQGTQELCYVAITNKGLRQANADAVFADSNLFIVADGVGMTKNSGFASEMAVQQIRDSYGTKHDLVAAVGQAHLSLKQYNQQHPADQPVGTTIVAAALLNRQCSVAWVGDSRAYLVDVNQQSIALLTQDHSLVNKLVEKGDITQEQAQSHPQRNVITRCLGLTQQDKIKVDSLAFAWLESQILLLCSDGLSGSLSNEKLLACLQQQGKSQQELAEDLVQKALAFGSKDNISLVLVAEQK